MNLSKIQSAAMSVDVSLRSKKRISVHYYLPPLRIQKAIYTSAYVNMSKTDIYYLSKLSRNIDPPLCCNVVKYWTSLQWAVCEVHIFLQIRVGIFFRYRILRPSRNINNGDQGEETRKDCRLFWKCFLFKWKIVYKSNHQSCHTARLLGRSEYLF